MGIFLFSLMGIPPFAGFLAKLYVFAAVIRTAIEQGSALLGWFAVIGVLNSVVAVFYYMKILKVMFIEETKHPSPGVASRSPSDLLGLLFVFVIPNIIGLVFGVIWIG